MYLHFSQLVGTYVNGKTTLAKLVIKLFGRACHAN